ncbi:hypothetical protein QMA09_02160 [Planococcus sp. APC 3906]|uniref:hypothetical protein n=1 Tax=Planococcus sp. APC 3906 TaxID=3035194 RepID=UPI0025B51C04|nr:hypothetical protein [Planococcus sp. APC 3906]MDN3448974.1 hypothetical protein [Planococcus sp. APC 3906]
MKKWSLKARLIYFGVIALVSAAFFALQFYAYQNGGQSTWEAMLLIVWGILAAFGIGGFVYSIARKGC